jgi:hypothetical protein
MKISKTERGFNNIDLKCKYGMPFYIRQSSGNMNDVWLGIIATEPEGTTRGGSSYNAIGQEVYSILIDDKVFKEIKKARKLARKRI